MVTTPRAMDSRKLTFITDHGSVRAIRSRARRVRPDGAAGAGRCCAAAAAAGTWVPRGGVGWPFEYVVGVE
ncbi:hypothetical protein ACFQZC_19255 [Streptacidiphilus monticola]